METHIYQSSLSLLEELVFDAKSLFKWIEEKKERVNFDPPAVLESHHIPLAIDVTKLDDAKRHPAKYIPGIDGNKVLLMTEKEQKHLFQAETKS